MDIKKKKVSGAQKRAQKKYDAKTKTIAIKYTPANMDEYDQLRKYLADINQSANSFIKGLIRQYLNNNPNRTEKRGLQNKLREKREEERKYYPFANIEKRNLLFLYMRLEKDIADEFLDEFDKKIESEIRGIIEEKGNHFDVWLSEKKEEIYNELHNNRGNEEKKKLIQQNLIDEIRLYIEEM